MGAVTYPNADVARFVDLNFIPVQIETSNTALMQKYAVSWTPTILVLDADGKEHYRTVGFLPPEVFIPTFQVGKGRYHLDLGQFSEARALFDEVIERCPAPEVVPEAVFSPKWCRRPSFSGGWPCTRPATTPNPCGRPMRP